MSTAIVAISVTWAFSVAVLNTLNSTRLDKLKRWQNWDITHNEYAGSLEGKYTSCSSLYKPTYVSLYTEPEVNKIIGNLQSAAFTIFATIARLSASCLAPFRDFFVTCAQCTICVTF